MALGSITSKLRAAVIIKGGSYYSSAVIITGNTVVHNNLIGHTGTKLIVK